MEMKKECAFLYSFNLVALFIKPRILFSSLFSKLRGTQQFPINPIAGNLALITIKSLKGPVALAFFPSFTEYKCDSKICKTTNVPDANIWWYLMMFDECRKCIGSASWPNIRKDKCNPSPWIHWKEANNRDPTARYKIQIWCPERKALRRILFSACDRTQGLTCISKYSTTKEHCIFGNSGSRK